MLLPGNMKVARSVDYCHLDEVATLPAGAKATAELMRAKAEIATNIILLLVEKFFVVDFLFS